MLGKLGSRLLGELGNWLLAKLAKKVTPNEFNIYDYNIKHITYKCNYTVN